MGEVEEEREREGAWSSLLSSLHGGGDEVTGNGDSDGACIQVCGENMWRDKARVRHRPSGG